MSRLAHALRSEDASWVQHSDKGAAVQAGAFERSRRLQLPNADRAGSVCYRGSLDTPEPRPGSAMIRLARAASKAFTRRSGAFSRRSDAPFSAAFRAPDEPPLAGLH